MNTVAHSSGRWFGRFAALALVGLGGWIFAEGAQHGQASDRAVVNPQNLLRQVKAYELKLNDLPTDMTVTIVKRATSPTEIHVEQGRARYDSSEGSLAAFPRKVREHLERMFGVTPIG